MSEKNPHWGSPLDVFLRENYIGDAGNPRAVTHESLVNAPPTTLEALRQVWLADKYPILGNEDLRVSKRMMDEALEQVRRAIPAPDDSPEFSTWISALRNPDLPGDKYDEIIFALYDFFDPERS